LQQAYPKLRFDYHIYSPEYKADIIRHIADSEGQILFSTLGMKSQEQSVIEVMDQCPNIKIGLGVGSSFDYII
jgi:UDP-N-acetyl-D-mannosaminuronic acid transferase (WecB/TagA/CpsF family)